MYNEELIDLLGVGENLKLFESPRGITVAGLEEVPVTNSRDIFKILERGWKKRATAETNLNKNSRFENHHILTPTEKFYFFGKHNSRSHSIFTVIIHTKDSTPEGEDLIKVGKL